MRSTLAEAIAEGPESYRPDSTPCEPQALSSLVVEFPELGIPCAKAARRAGAGWPVAEGPSNLPFVAEWIDHSSHEPAMSLGDLAHKPGAGRCFANGGRIIHDHQESSRGSADGSGSEPPHPLGCPRVPKTYTAERQLNDAIDIIGIADAVLDDRAERALVVVNRRRGVLNP